MILILALLAAIAAAWLLIAFIEAHRLGLGLVQAILYAPLKLFYRIDDQRVRVARAATAPVIYVVVHKGRLEPALMLSLLPPDTLHTLDEASARSAWLEPWRELARTIAFNAKHVFVSRRLVRALKGKGRLAVYVPDAVEPDVKSFRLYRAIARIATQADARIVPIFVDGARVAARAFPPKAKPARRWFPSLVVSVLEPMTIAELTARTAPAANAANALFDYVAEARVAASAEEQSLFGATLAAANRIGASHVIVEDAAGGALSYRKLLIGARVLGKRFHAATRTGEAVGGLLPNSNALVLTLLGLV